VIRRLLAKVKKWLGSGRGAEISRETLEQRRAAESDEQFGGHRRWPLASG
jgi:hypothetical protein